MFLKTLDTPGARLTGLTLDGAFAPDTSGVLIKADDCLIQDCEIQNLDGIAIYVQSGKRFAIRHTKIHDTWRQGIATVGADTDFTGSVIEWNDIRRTGYDSIEIGGVGIIAQDNHMADGPFGGLYALTGAKNCKLLRNTVENTYGGFDLSWGIAGLNRAGTTLTRRLVAQNRVIGCGMGIGTAGSGTVIRDNEIHDCGKGQQQTYTLLNIMPQIVDPGGEYKVGDVLSFLGGITDFNPAKVRVTGVDNAGGITGIAMQYIGCYYTAPSNPIICARGSGTGAAFRIAKWNKRTFKPFGISIVDASYCTVTGNISGNTHPARKYQKIGCLLTYVFDKPLHNAIVGNSFPYNADYSVAGLRGSSYDQTLLAGNQIGPNAS